MAIKSAEAKERAKKTRKIRDARNREKLNEQMREYRKKNPEIIKAIKQRQWQNNKESIGSRNKAWRDSNKNVTKNQKLRAQYGITLDDYHCMLVAQNNCCALCGKEFGDTQFTRPAVDHCHNTGKVRGLLHGQCNTGLGFFNDDIDLLLKAAEYLTPPLQMANQSV